MMAINLNVPRIFTLPLEIRLEIYNYLLIHPTFNPYEKLNSPSVCTISTDDLLNRAGKPVIYCVTIRTALLLVCKQIHAEAISILYSRNSFRFHHPKILLKFLIQIGQANIRHIKHLQIVVPWNQESWIFWPAELLCKLSSDAKNLQNVEITFERIPSDRAQIYGFGSYDDIVSLVVGRRLSLEFNLGLALRRLAGLERIIVYGGYSEGWLELLGKTIGCKVLSNKLMEIADDRSLPQSK